MLVSPVIIVSNALTDQWGFPQLRPHERFMFINVQIRARTLAQSLAQTLKL